LEELPDRIKTVFADRYLLEAILGKGASGVVYLATDQETGNKVALKVVTSEFFSSNQLRRRFMREAGIVKDIEHPNVLATLKSGTYGDVFFHVMEYCKSGNLEECMGELSVSKESAIELMIQICKGLRVLHQKKIIHRDLKAANILVGDDGNLKIADFGIAQWQSTDLTKTRSVGTPTGMAPELWNGEDASERSDIYALGVLFYEFLTHKRPFSGETIGELAYSHLFTTPRPPSDFVACGPILENLIGRMLVRNKWDRIGSVDEVLDILEALRLGEKQAMVTASYALDDTDAMVVDRRGYF